MDPKLILYFILIFVCIIASFFFSLTETSYSCLNKYRIKIAADDGNKRAKLVMKIIDKFNVSLSTILIGNNIAAILLSMASTFLFTEAFESTSLDEGVISIIASIIITIFVFIFGETLPKHIGKRIPNKVAIKTSYFLIFFIILFLPISLILVGLSSLINLLSKNKKEVALTEDDFNSVIESNEEKGALEDNETDIIQASFDFNDTAINEVLTKVDKIYAIDIKDISVDRLAKIVARTNYSRIPLYYGNINKIVGVLIVKTFLSSYLKDKNVDFKKLIQKPYIIQDDIKIDDLIDGFRTNHTQIALVYKDKKLFGMVTMNDVLEELIGPIKEGDSGGEL